MTNQEFIGSAAKNPLEATLVNALLDSPLRSE